MGPGVGKVLWLSLCSTVCSLDDTGGSDQDGPETPAPRCVSLPPAKKGGCVFIVLFAVGRAGAQRSGRAHSRSRGWGTVKRDLNPRPLTTIPHCSPAPLCSPIWAQGRRECGRALLGLRCGLRCGLRSGTRVSGSNPPVHLRCPPISLLTPQQPQCRPVEARTCVAPPPRRLQPALRPNPQDVSPPCFSMVPGTR